MINLVAANAYYGLDETNVLCLHLFGEYVYQYLFIVCYGGRSTPCVSLFRVGGIIYQVSGMGTHAYHIRGVGERVNVQPQAGEGAFISPMRRVPEVPSHTL